jgi:uncharacterized membrane protein (UPF0182 family)
VVTHKRLFWIQDGYTTSQWYPNAAPYDAESNYIRNSVKIVVDAYDGTITYYIMDSTDPIIRAYQRMYPGLLQDFEEMPSDLKSHVRYPKGLFEEQMRIYGKYHQKDPELFYRQEDIWEFPRSYRGETPDRMRPYYLTLSLIETGKDEFLLICPMIPRGRDNLRSLAIVRCDENHYGQIIVYSFPKGQQVYGPSQINTLVDQDTDIAQQFTLWDQAGSEVNRGRIIILPIGKVIFYVQPVYLSSAARLKIPELKRLIVSQGDLAVMDVTLEEAFQRLERRLKEKIERIEKRFQVPKATPQITDQEPAQEP